STSLTELFHDDGRDVANPVGVDVTRPRRAHEFGGLNVTEVREDTLQDPLQADVVDGLPLALRLTAAARVETTDLDRGAEAVGKVGRVEHRVEQLQQPVLQPHRLVDLAGERQVVKHAGQLRRHAAGGVRASVATDQ